MGSSRSLNTLAAAVAPLHPKNDMFPGEVFVRVGACGGGSGANSRISSWRTPTRMDVDGVGAGSSDSQQADLGSPTAAGQPGDPLTRSQIPTKA